LRVVETEVDARTVVGGVGCKVAAYMNDW